MRSRPPSRGRSQIPSHHPPSVAPLQKSPIPPRSRSRSPRRSISPRSLSYSRSRSRTPSRTPPARNGRNGERHGRSVARSPSRSRSPDRDRGSRRYRERSHSRIQSPENRAPQSSKIVVEKLTKNVNEGHLREIFGSYGEIESIDLPMNRQCMLLFNIMEVLC